MTRLMHSEDVDGVAAQWIARRDAGLSPAEKCEFEAWLRQNPKHAEAFGRFETAWATVGRPRRTGAGEEVRRQIGVLKRRRRRRVAIATVVVAVGLFVGGTFLRHPGAPHVPATATLLVSEHRLLPDGSIVDLRPGAKIAVDYRLQTRRVTLERGEALFEVAKNEDRPFVVTANGIEVRAVGTAFSVQISPRTVEVFVTEGRVSIAPPPLAPAVFPAAAPLAYVDAGSRIVVDTAAAAPKADSIVAVTPAEAAEKLAWRDPHVEFSGTPLSDVLTVINRYNRIQIVVDPSSPQLAHEQLSGLFRANDTKAFLKMLESGFGVSSEDRGDEIVLRKR